MRVTLFIKILTPCLCCSLSPSPSSSSSSLSHPSARTALHCIMFFHRLKEMMGCFSASWFSPTPFFFSFLYAFMDLFYFVFLTSWYRGIVVSARFGVLGFVFVYFFCLCMLLRFCHALFLFYFLFPPSFLFSTLFSSYCCLVRVL